MDISEMIQSPILKKNDNINFHVRNKSITSRQCNNQFDGFSQTNYIPSFKLGIEKNITEDNACIASMNSQETNNFSLGTEGVISLENTKDNDSSEFNHSFIGHDKSKLCQKKIEVRDQTEKEIETQLVESFLEITISNPKLENINEMHIDISKCSNQNSTNLCSKNFNKP